MTGFGVVLGTNLLGLIVVIIRGDIVWCVAATWVAVSIWTATPKPAPVYVSDQAKIGETRNSMDNIDHDYTLHCSSSCRAACNFCLFPVPWSWTSDATTRK